MYKLLDVVKKEIGTFKEHLPLVQILCNPGLRERHWKSMSEVVGDNITPNSSTTLNRMIALDLGKHMEDMESVSGGASKEFSLEKAMNKMEEEWKPMAFGNSTYRDTGFAILASVDDIQAQLDDHIVKTQTMKGSPFIKPFKEQIEVWERTMVEMQDIIDGWLKMQATWLYLEPIFSSPDIMSQMPKEGELFIGVDACFKGIMAHMLQDPNCITTCKMAGMLEQIVQSNDDLELIIKGLNDYLEKKVRPRVTLLTHGSFLPLSCCHWYERHHQPITHPCCSVLFCSVCTLHDFSSSRTTRCLRSFPRRKIQHASSLT
jgi:dynein heavy chain